MATARAPPELQHRDEIPDHPWYVAVQFHPEFKSKPLRPHPLFAGFVEAAVQQGKRKVRTGATVTAISDRVAR